MIHNPNMPVIPPTIMDYPVSNVKDIIAAMDKVAQLEVYRWMHDVLDCRIYDK